MLFQFSIFFTMSSSVDINTLNLLFKPEFNVCPEKIIAALCESHLSKQGSKNKDSEERDLDLITSILSSKWTYESSSPGVKASISQLFSFTLASLHDDKHQTNSVVSFLVSCVCLEDSQTFFSKKLMLYLVKFLDGVYLDLKVNQINSDWCEDCSSKRHVGFSLLENLVQMEQVECLSNVLPKLCDILALIPGFPFLHKQITRILFNSMQILLKSNHGQVVVKSMILQMLNHVHQFQPSTVSCGEKEKNSCIAKCISICHLAMETMESIVENLDTDLYLQTLSDPTVWCVMQAGLHHSKSVTRKTALNCLRYTINFVKVKKLETNVCLPTSEKEGGLKLFSSTSEFESFREWLHFISICETLEENQIHVIRPVLSKLLGLFSTSEKNQIPLDWLLIVARRMLSHDSKHVQQEGVTLILRLDNSNYPIALQPSFVSFVVNDFLLVLKDESIYYCSSVDTNKDLNTVPIMLGDFFKSCYVMLPQVKKQTLLKQLLSGLNNSSWSPVSMVYVASSMLSIPHSKCWGRKEVQTLRTLIFQSVKGNSKPLTIALQRIFFLLLISHTDVTDTKMEELLSFFVLCFEQKLILRPSRLWTRCSQWLVNSFGLTDGSTDFFQTAISWFKRIFNSTGCHDPAKKFNNDSSVLLMLLVLYADANSPKHLPQHDALIKNMTSQVKSITDKAATHPYLSHNQVLSCFQFIKALVTYETSKNAIPSVTVLSCLWQLWPGIVEFVARKLPAYSDSMFALECYLDTADALVNLYWETQYRNKMMAQGIRMMESLILTSIVIIEKTIKAPKAKENVLSTAYRTLTWSCTMCQKFDFKLMKDASNRLTAFLLNFDCQLAELSLIKIGDRDDCTEVREMVKMHWWSVVPFVFDFRLNLKAEDTSTSNYLLCLLDQIEVASYDHLAALFNIAQTLLYNACQKAHLNSDNSSVCSKMIKLLWKTTYDLQNSSVFRHLYKALIGAVVQKEVIVCKSDEVTNAVKYVLNEIQAESQNKPLLLQKLVVSMANIVAECKDTCSNTTKADVLSTVLLLNVENSSITSSARHIEDYLDFLVHCATISTVPSKSALLTEQALNHMRQLLPDQIPVPDLDKLVEINLLASSVLLELATNNPNFGAICLKYLMNMEMTLSKSKDRCHFNSTIHLTKQKLWQNVLLFIPFADSDLKLINDVLCFLSQNVQASIRHFMEWCLTLLLIRYPMHRELLFQRLQHNCMGDVTFPAMCSYLTVALLLGIAQNQSCQQFQIQYFLDLAEVVIPWCMTQHFTIRLCALAVLQRTKLLFEDNEKLNQLRKSFPSVETCLNFADNSSGNVKTNWQRIKQSPVLFHFHPVLDVSMETIFCSLPRLCHVTHPNVNVLEKLMQFHAWVPARNDRDILRNLPKSVWLSSVSTKPEKSIKEEPQGDLTSGMNMQKKIVVSNTQATKKSGLVLVASLIDKPSNLGGLARTCEVFGAERLVVHTLSCVEDKFFQSLSVTAHKWLRMDEVKRWDLEKYVVDMKAKGYTIIGTEQTEQSECLSNYRFPAKCVILLGNEKEGIPPALLRCLDVCLEIPQVGVIRSLNVHVSGAITVWEYAKQAISANKA